MPRIRKGSCSASSDGCKKVCATPESKACAPRRLANNVASNSESPSCARKAATISAGGATRVQRGDVPRESLVKGIETAPATGLGFVIIVVIPAEIGKVIVEFVEQVQELRVPRRDHFES